MKKIIFLDIDGVIATPDYLKDGMWALNPEKQKLLGRIIEKTHNFCFKIMYYGKGNSRWKC